MGSHLPHFGRSWPCFQCHVSKSLVHSLFTLIHILCLTVHHHWCYDELLRYCRTCRDVFCFLGVCKWVLIWYVCFLKERERRSPALNLHMSAFPENSSSALQMYCHQEGVKVITHLHKLTLFSLKTTSSQYDVWFWPVCRTSSFLSWWRNWISWGIMEWVQTRCWIKNNIWYLF